MTSTAFIVCPTLIACTDVTKPTVGHIPDGWYLSDYAPYGSYENNDGTKWGEIHYSDELYVNHALIYWGDIPWKLKGNETNKDNLIEQAILHSYTFEPTETGTMTIGGRLAGYTRAYDEENGLYEMDIVFVIGSTCINIYTFFDATAADEAQTMSLINSIR